MSARERYELEVVGEFAAAHVLRGYAGACERIHGHNFKVAVTVQAHALDDLGMAIDFVELERMLQRTLAPLDHQLLNELPAFAGRNPTAETIAAHVWAALQAALADRPGGAPVRLIAVTVRENDRYTVRYAGPDAAP